MSSMSSKENRKDTIQDMGSTSEKYKAPYFFRLFKEFCIKHDQNSEMKSNENNATSVSVKPPGNSYWIEALDLINRENVLLKIDTGCVTKL